MLFLLLEHWAIASVLKKVLKTIDLATIVRFLIVTEYRLGSFLSEVSEKPGLEHLLQESFIEIGHAHFLLDLYREIDPTGKIDLHSNNRISVIDDNGKKNAIRYIRGGTARINPVQRFLGCDCLDLSNNDLLAMYGELEHSLCFLYQSLSSLTGYKEFDQIAKDEQNQSKSFSQNIPLSLRIKWKSKKTLAWIQFLIRKEYQTKEIKQCLSLRLVK